MSVNNALGILPIEKSLQFDFEHKFDEILEGYPWKFPGKGEKYESCGKTIFRACMNTKHHPEGKAYVEKHKNNCKRSICPECYRKWLVDTTKNIENRIWEGKPLQGKQRRPIHVTISIPKLEWDKTLLLENFRKLRRKINRIAKKSGMFGGCTIYHDQREKCDKCGNRKCFDRKICVKCGNDSFVWYKSPHFHLIGYGWIVGASELYEKTGYIVKNLGARISVGATVYYQLSHCSIRKGIQAVCWFGSLSWKKLKVERIKNETIECPYCGYSLKRVRYFQFGSIPKLKLPEDFESGLIDSRYWRFAKLL